MDRIFLRGLELDTVIGVHAWEQRVPQKLVVDVELAHDLRPAGASDRLADSIDYARVASTLQTVAGGHRYQLLEALAQAMARALVVEGGASEVRLTLHKPGAVPGAKDVGIVIERSRADYATDTP